MSFKPRLYFWSLFTAASLTAAGLMLGGVFMPIDQALIYIGGAVIVAANLERGPSLLYSFVSVTCFNFFFVPPVYSLNVYDRSYWLTFAVMLVTSLVITGQASRLRLQAIAAEKSSIDVEREKLRATLLSSVSHDLRTPLASITGASSAIVTDIDRLPRDLIRELGQSINKEAERLSHIVTNLLEVTRLESSVLQLNTQPYFIEELIGSALERLEILLEKHVIVTSSDENLPLVFVDGVLIEQVLINLLENAARYTPEGSIITVSACREDDNVLICIADNGPGIPGGNEKRIFDKFYGLSNDRAQKGTGLGLAICSGIVKAHQGSIWAANNPQGGAQFYFSVPVSPAILLEEQGAGHA